MEKDYAEADYGEESTYYDFLGRISLHVPHYLAERRYFQSTKSVLLTPALLLEYIAAL